MREEVVREILARLAECTADERRAVYDALRLEFPMHSLEQEFGVSAEVILEAISRASDLTKRGILGVIAEAEFKALLRTLPQWTDVTTPGDHPYDYAVDDGHGVVHVQVKRQRREKLMPMLSPSGTMYAAETQRTRGGTGSDGQKTRPYRFGEFDILAVSMQASSSSWRDFMYTVERWLIPDYRDPKCLRTLQYIPKQPNDDWTADFSAAVNWFRSSVKKTIADDPKRQARKRLL